ncbi:hypothetical protein CK203_030097 [Vitis vinifera]|uniref:Uncharacterized protein n=1 Tax=Vitis vinifera TaxID=29760 RepID=A0A438I5E0_VITVI|nr:hypothetical protein CK203_030097 [Vitis vinifera]
MGSLEKAGSNYGGYHFTYGRSTPEEDCGTMGTVNEIDWRTLKLFDLSRARLKIAMKDRAILPALLERGRSTAGGRYRVEKDSRRRKEGERGKAVITSAGKRGKGCQLPSQSRLTSNKSVDGLDGIEEVGGDWAGEDEAIVDVGCRAYERKAQSLSKSGPRVAIMGCKLKGLLGLGLSPEKFIPVETVASLRKEEDSSANEKGKTTPGLLEVQLSRFAKKKVLYGSRKLWSTFFSPSSEHRQGIRCCSEPISLGKIKADSEEDPKAEASGEGASSLRNEADLNNFSSDEDMERFLGRVGSDPRGSAVMVMPSTPETRGKGPSLLGNCGSMVAENLESYPHASRFQFLNLRSNFCDIPNLEMEVIQPACPYQMFESVNPLSSNLRSPIKESSMAAINLGGGRADAPQDCETSWIWFGDQGQKQKRRSVIEGSWVVFGQPEIRMGSPSGEWGFGWDFDHLGL